MITFEAIDVLLRVQNLPGFVARMRAASSSVQMVGRAARSQSASTAAAVMSAARKATAGLAMLAAAAGVASFRQSVEFEKQTTLIHTQAGASMAEVRGMRNELLGMAHSGAFVQGPQDLAKGLYHLESVGLRGKNAINALRIAAQGAAVGNASLENTTTALGSAWLALGDSGMNLKTVMSILNATVGAGNMRMDELVTALGTGVLPTAKLAGLQLQDTMGALAILKDEGYGAYGAMAQFATALHFFTSPTDKATAAMKRMGLAQMQIADTMRNQGMVPALQLLRDRLNAISTDPTKQLQILGQILPGGRGRVILTLINQLDRYQMKIDQINRTSGNFDESVRTTMTTSAARMHAAWSGLQASLIQLGDTIRTQGTSSVVFFVGVLNGLIKVLTFLVKHLNEVMIVFGPFVAAWLLYKTAVIQATIAQAIWNGIMSVRAFLSLAMGVRSLADAWALLDVMMMDNPIFIIITALVALAVGLYEAYKHVAWFRNAVNAVWSWLSHAVVNSINFIVKHWKTFIWALGPFAVPILLIARHFEFFKGVVVGAFHVIEAVARFVFNFVKAHWAWMISAMFGPFAPFVHYIITHFKSIEHAGSVVAKSIAHFFVAAFNKVKHAAKDAKDWLLKYTPAGAVNWAADQLGLPHFAGGTMSAPGGWSVVGERGPELMRVPGGAKIIPNNKLGNAFGGGMMTSVTKQILQPATASGGGVVNEEHHHHIYIDGKEITEVVTHRIANKKARR